MNFEVGFQAGLVDPSVFIAPQAIVRGQVRIDADSSIWFGAVVRGDTHAIEIGPQSNVQDLALLHTDAGITCRLGARVTVGHGAIVHGSIVEDDCLIGMRATLLNHTRIGAGSLVAAGSLVTEGTIIPPRSLVMGAPAVVRRVVNDTDLARIKHAAQHYVKLAAAYRLQQLQPEQP
ncbi:MAG: gamma carbonic anhydrase family protein [Planctomycetaceae bacterium]|nr:gamma carbonic anhydrase family protein [Planctomycetaceae bacterium]